jgi:hypothetical protein
MWQTLLDGLTILSEKWLVVLGAVSVIGLGCSPSFFFARGASKAKIHWQSVLLLVFFFAISVLLRLAFITRTFVPPYFDSVEHFRIVKGLMNALESSTLLKTIPTLTPGYYHLGFHLLAAFLTFGLHASPMDVILVLGQVILAAIPIPIFFILRHKPHNDIAAFFGTLLAGFGWYVPGFAVNWGKYPALAGLLAFEIVLSMAYFISQHKFHRNQITWIGILFLGIVISTFFHSRTLVVIAFSFASWFIAGKIQTLPKIFQYVSLGTLLAGLVVLGILIQREPLLALALEPYLNDGLWITLIVVLLSPFALIKFPRGLYFSLLFMLCVFVALFIPIGNLVPGFENQTLLDRPFVEMLLYLPLSILGGLGLAGLMQSVPGIQVFPEQARAYAAILVVGLTGLIALARYNFYPSDCCNFVKYDDTVAFDWLDKNLPTDAHILIASTSMNVLPSGPSASPTGTDAGIWIPALTGRETTFAPFDIDFSATGTLNQLCQMQIDYIYVGGTTQRFNTAQLQAKAAWYKEILFLPNAQLYQLTGCNKYRSYAIAKEGPENKEDVLRTSSLFSVSFHELRKVTAPLGSDRRWGHT